MSTRGVLPVKEHSIALRVETAAPIGIRGQAVIDRSLVYKL